MCPEWGIVLPLLFLKKRSKRLVLLIHSLLYIDSVYPISIILISAAEVEVVFSHRAKRQYEAQHDKHAKYRICHPHARQQIVPEVMHVVRRVLQRREPCGPQVRDIHLLLVQLHKRVKRLRVQQEAVKAEYEYAGNTPELAAADIDHEHDGHHEQCVEQHEQKYRTHAFIRCGHLERFDKRGQRHSFARSRVPEYCGGFTPHVADKALPHTDKRGGDKHKQHIGRRRKADVEYLPPKPCAAAYARQIVRHTRAKERHVREQQHKQQRR